MKLGDYLKTKTRADAQPPPHGPGDSQKETDLGPDPEDTCDPPHPGETCSEYRARAADDMAEEAAGRKPRPNQKVWDMFDEYRAKLEGRDWKPPFPEIYERQGIHDRPSDPDPFEQAHRDMGF